MKKILSLLLTLIFLAGISVYGQVKSAASEVEGNNKKTAASQMDGEQFSPLRTEGVKHYSNNLKAGFAPGCQINALLLTNERLEYINDVQSKLFATGFFSNLDVVSGSSPTLATLLNYNSVLVWADFALDDAIGETLADYIDAGGGVVSSVFNLFTFWGIEGTRFNTDYLLMNLGSFSLRAPVTIGTVYDVNHPLMDNVTSLSNNNTYRSKNASVTPGSVIIAEWSDGLPLVVVKENLGPSNARRADINLWPPSSDARPDLWDASTDGAQLLANALVWVAQECQCPNDMVVDNDPGVCGALVEYETPAGTQTEGLASGSVFPVGTTLNVFTDPDCTFSVTVVDNEDPTFFPSGEVVPNIPVTISQLGRKSTYTNVQLNGGLNVITVEPGEPVTLTANWSSAYDGGAGCPGCITQHHIGLGSIFNFCHNAGGGSGLINQAFNAPVIPGIYYINQRATWWYYCGQFGEPVHDNNSATAIAVIIVESFPSNVLVNNDPGICGAVVNYLSPAAYDNCGSETTQIEGLPSGSVFPVGTTNNIFKATDAAGNSTTASFTVTVIDNEDPVAVCQAFNIQLDMNGEATITPDDIDGGSSDNCGFTLSATPIQFDCAAIEANGSHDFEVTLKITDDSGNTDECVAIVTVIERETIITYNGVWSGQYSDPVDLSATLTDALTGTELEGIELTFEIGSQSVSALTGADGIAATSLILDQNPCDEYTVKVTSEHVCPFLPGEDEDVFDIEPEDVEIAYIGVLFQATPGPDEYTAVVKLMATVKEVDDGYPGDITNAKVSFVDRDGGSIAECIPVEFFVDPNDPNTGVVTFDWEVTIPGNENAVITTLGTLVGLPDCDDCYFQHNDTEDDVVVAVYRPDGDFITGGGYIMPTMSAGPYASDIGSKANYGFNVKYNKKGTKLQGKFTMIIRSDGRVYQIKSNATESLGVNIADPEKDAAVFTAKANLKDVTDEIALDLGGNLILQVNMTDRGEPGVNDEIGISLWSAVKAGNQWTADEMLYSSEWDGLQTLEQYIAGGNLVVHSGSDIDLGLKSGVITLDSDNPVAGLNIYPNPFRERAIFEITAATDSKAKLDIYDATGRKLATLIDQNVKAGQEYRLEYEPGIIANGILFYTLVIDNDIKTGKLIHRR